jgi:hypothetical protein
MLTQCLLCSIDAYHHVPDRLVRSIPLDSWECLPGGVFHNLHFVDSMSTIGVDSPRQRSMLV